MHAYAGVEKNIGYADATKLLQRIKTKELSDVRNTFFHNSENDIFCIVPCIVHGSSSFICIILCKPLLARRQFQSM